MQSFSRYSYVFNNPLTHTDSSGVQSAAKKSGSEAAPASTLLAGNAEGYQSLDFCAEENLTISTPPPRVQRIEVALGKLTPEATPVLRILRVKSFSLALLIGGNEA